MFGYVQDWGKGTAVSERDLFQPGPILAIDIDPTSGRHTVTLTIEVDQVVTATSLLRSAVCASALSF